MKTVAIIGANGQLGTDLVGVFGARRWRVFPFDLPNFDVTDWAKTRILLGRAKPDLVINTAAYHFLPDCEKHPEIAFEVNALAIKNLANWASEHNIVLMHLSSDYVFGGKLLSRAYKEEDAVAPQSVYAVSKAAGEWLLRQTCRKYFLIRTSGLFGKAGTAAKGGNFVDKRIEQAMKKETIYMVEDQVLCPTYTKNLAENIELLVGTKKYGLYHMVSRGNCSWYEFTKEILRLTKLKTKLTAVKTDDSKAGVVRPRYSVLSISKLRLLGLSGMNHWKKNLKLYLQEKGYIND